MWLFGETFFVMGRRTIPRFVLHVAIVAVVVFAVLYVASAQLPVTGFLTFNKNVSVSINREKGGEISFFDFDQVITKGESTNVSVELRNIGSVPINSTYRLEVYDVNNTLLYTYPGPTKMLPPGAIMGRTIKHTPHETGTYVLRLRAHMGRNVLQTAKFLLVQSKPVPQPPQPIVITQVEVNYVYGPKPPTPTPLSRSWRVSAPRTIDLGQNDSTTLPITVTNTGEATLRNVRLSLDSSQEIGVEYDPKIMFGIPANTTRNFMLTVTSAGNLSDQTISYHVVSDKLSQNGETSVNIVPTTTIAQLKNEVAKLQVLINDAERQMQKMDANGLDTSEARALLQTVKKQVDTAQTAISNEKLDAARTSINTARGDMGDVFQKLFKARSEQLVVSAPLVQPVYVLILASILIAVVLVGGYYYLETKHEERPKLLRDLEEEEA